MKKTTMIITSVLLLIVVSAGAYFLSRQNPDTTMMQKDDSLAPSMSIESDNNSGSMQKEENNDENGTMTKTGDSAMKSGDSMTKTGTGDGAMSAPSYAEFSPGVLEKTASTKRVLFFYASWCPTCVPADAEFMKNQDKIPDGVTVIRVNYNDPQTDEDEKALAQKYGVTYQHTYVQIDSNGQQVKKWNGGALNELLSNIK